MRRGSRPRSRRGANGGTSPLAAGRTYHAHVGTRQRLRVLRRNWEAIEDRCRRVPGADAARAALIDFVFQVIPHATAERQEEAVLRLGLASMQSAVARGCTWEIAAAAVLADPLARALVAGLHAEGDAGPALIDARRGRDRTRAPIAD